MTPEQIIEELRRQARENREAPMWIDPPDFTTPQGLADRRETIQAASDGLWLLAAAVAGWAAAIGLHLILGGVQ